MRGKAVRESPCSNITVISVWDSCFVFRFLPQECLEGCQYRLNSHIVLDFWIFVATSNNDLQVHYETLMNDLRHYPRSAVLS